LREVARRAGGGIAALFLLLFAAPAVAQTPPIQGTRAPAAATAQDMAARVLDKDMELFLTWFPGRWDNDLQVFFADDLKTPAEARHERIHSIFQPVDLPAFSGKVFYVQQYLDGDPTKLYRQRIYTFTPDYAANAIRLAIWTPSDPARIRDAHRDPSKLAGLTPADFRNLPGCDVFWRRQSNQFIGTMTPGACRIPSSRAGGRTIIITDDLVLTPDQIWIRDKAVDDQGAYVFGNKADVHHKLDKARPFLCWGGVLRGARHGDSGAGAPDSQWSGFRNLWIHDRGGTATFTTDETPPRQLTLTLRRVAWPFGSSRPSLTLYVSEKPGERAISYAWAEEDAERVGVNLRWMQASCTHTPGAVGP
jgi:hypothetical protein